MDQCSCKLGCNLHKTSLAVHFEVLVCSCDVGRLIVVDSLRSYLMPCGAGLCFWIIFFSSRKMFN